MPRAFRKEAGFFKAYHIVSGLRECEKNMGFVEPMSPGDVPANRMPLCF